MIGNSVKSQTRICQARRGETKKLLRKEDLLNEIRFEYKVYPLSRTFLSNRQTVTVTFPADNFLFPIGCMK